MWWVMAEPHEYPSSVLIISSLNGHAWFQCVCFLLLNTKVLSTHLSLLIADCISAILPTSITKPCSTFPLLSPLVFCSSVQQFFFALSDIKATWLFGIYMPCKYRQGFASSRHRENSINLNRGRARVCNPSVIAFSRRISVFRECQIQLQLEKRFSR